MTSSKANKLSPSGIYDNSNIHSFINFHVMQQYSDRKELINKETGNLN